MKFEVHHHFIDKMAFINGFISGVALYPQAYSFIMGGSTTGISLTTFLLIFINSIVWLLYAIHRALISLAIASILNCIASGIIIFIVAFY